MEKYPGKLEWILLAGGTALLLINSSARSTEAQDPTPEIISNLTSIPDQYHSIEGPFPFAKRVHCHDTGSYSDKRLNFACGQEKHQ